VALSPNLHARAATCHPRVVLSRHNVPLAPLTTLKVGGSAARLVELEREEDVELALREAAAREEPAIILGGGSNVVVGDEGFQGVVLRMATRGVEVHREDGRVIVWVAAGEDWDTLVARAVDEGWRGIESMSGIPGLVGATPVQNVGAYGQEVSDTIVRVRVFDRTAMAPVELDPNDCAFGYRTSIFKRSARYVVTRVCFAFDRADKGIVRYPELARALGVSEGESVPLRVVRDTVLALRRAKGMVLDPSDPDSVSAGSFFVNPIVDGGALHAIESAAGERPPRFEAAAGKKKVPAAWLVERAGFAKGFSLGRAAISSKHALALVNRGGASARELLSLARLIRDRVCSRFGVVLEPEPVLIGASWENGSL
jgi:UDP-N-acetylmuramate dehydrogenase